MLLKYFMKQAYKIKTKIYSDLERDIFDYIKNIITYIIKYHRPFLHISNYQYLD